VEARPVFSSDGSRLAAGLPDGRIKVWDLADFQEVCAFKWSPSFLYLSRDSCRLVTWKGGMRLRDVVAGKDIATFKDIYNWVKFSPDGKYLIGFKTPAGKRFPDFRLDNQAQVWDARTGAEVSTLTGKFGFGAPLPANWLAFSPDGTRLAAITTPLTLAPSEILLWDIATGKELLRLKGHSVPPLHMVFSPDGKRIATAAEGELKLWDSATGKELLSLRLGDTNLRFLELFFSRDGARLFMQEYGAFRPGPRLTRPLVWDATPLPEKR
jgi:WD40 repeat protein